MILKFTLHGEARALDMSKVQAMGWSAQALCTEVYLDGACNVLVPLPFSEVFWLWSEVRGKYPDAFEVVDLDGGRCAVDLHQDQKDRLRRLRQIYRALSEKRAEAPLQPEEVPFQ
jgi:hypothetical protein